MAAKHGGKIASQVPISKHPAFPAIVALWFAALLGIGSLVLPASLFEAAIGASGIAGVLPAAEPPLGVTARILIALVAATLGVIAGLIIARKVAAAQGDVAPAPRAAREVRSSAKRPISAHEELWSEGFDEPVEDVRPAPVAGRRRALSVTDESGPSDLLDSVPLPGGEAEIVFDPAPDPVEDDALELAAFAQSVEIESDFEPVEPAVPEFAETRDEEGEAAPEPMSPPPAPEPDLSFEPARPFDAPSITPEPFAAPLSEADALENAEPIDAVAPQESIAFKPTTADSEVQEPALGELSIADLVERFALSLQHAAARAEAEARVEPQAAAGEVDPPPRYVPDLGVEAIEAPRFAPAPEPIAAQQADDAPAENPAAQPAEEPAGAIPAALRPVAFGEDDADEDVSEEFSLTLSLAPEARPFDRPTASAAPAEPEEIGDAPDHGYSSLLDMRKQAAGREFVRIEDDATCDAAEDEAIEPIVVFPGQDQRRAAPPADRPVDTGARPFAAPATAKGSASDSIQTERALREALHKLQRLSGAA